MRLKTKLVLSAMGVTFALVLALSLVFLAQLLRQRIDQTVADNEVLAHQVLLMTRQAIEVGLQENPPANVSPASLDAAVRDGLRHHDPLMDTMDAIIRYSPTVQDVSVTDAQKRTLVSTNPDALDQLAPGRVSLRTLREARVTRQIYEMFGPPHVFDIALPLDRNGKPFVVVHLGVRSSFLRAVFEPRFRAALWFVVAAILLSMMAAALLASAALRPMERIGEQLERLARSRETASASAGGLRSREDTVVQVHRTIDRLGTQIRTTEAEYTALQSNLDRMLDTLRDGVLLFAADGRAVMVSDAVAHFVKGVEAPVSHDAMVGRRAEEIFASETALGMAVRRAFASDEATLAETVVLEDGRRIQLSADRIRHGSGKGDMGTLVTLRDTESALKLEQELEVSRRLMAIGRLTAGVGHEVKNPINAMVLHLELLRSKLAADGSETLQGAQRHVEILSGEMQRLDRVVQTLADFTKPLELHLGTLDLQKIVRSVVELTGAEMAGNGVRVELAAPVGAMMVRVDADLIRQAMLNLLLNAMQAMPEGGAIQVGLRREEQSAVLEITDEGEGIPPELLPRIFDLYFTTKPLGTGIGLAITYRILQMHGGALEVRSSLSSVSEAVPQGTTFTLRLPLSLMSVPEPVPYAPVDPARLMDVETRA